MIEYVAVATVIVATYWVGREQGIRAERLRVTHAFDVALGIVSSGALHKVRRRVKNEVTNEQMVDQLYREAGHRHEERKRMLAWGDKDRS